MKRSRSTNYIDLTEEEVVPAAQRRRTIASSSLRPVEDLEDVMLAEALRASVVADPDVQLLEPEERQAPSFAAAAAPSDDDEELAVLGTTGQVRSQDH